MNFLIIVVILLLLAGLLAAMKLKSTSKDDSLSFVSRQTLFSPAERSFLGVIEKALDNKYRVFGKVRLGDLVMPAKGLSNSKRFTGLNKVNQKHIDFVICSVTDLAVLGVVELDDQSHKREDREVRDVFVDRALNSAGIPIARFSAKKGYQIQEVRVKLAEAFKLDLSMAPAPRLAAQDSVPLQPISVEEPEQTTAAPTPVIQDTMPICGKCGAPMIKRQAKTGVHAGKFFWACTTYPKCREVAAITENDSTE